MKILNCEINLRWKTNVKWRKQWNGSRFDVSGFWCNFKGVKECWWIFRCLPYVSEWSVSISYVEILVRMQGVEVTSVTHKWNGDASDIDVCTSLTRRRGQMVAKHRLESKHSIIWTISPKYGWKSRDQTSCKLVKDPCWDSPTPGYKSRVPPVHQRNLMRTGLFPKLPRFTVKRDANVHWLWMHREGDLSILWFLPTTTV
jgi:hypothetical protein